MSAWIPWSGGECPVPDESICDLQFRNAATEFGVTVSGSENADAMYGPAFWKSEDLDFDITSYRLHQPAQPVAAAPVTGDEQRAWDMFAAAALQGAVIANFTMAGRITVRSETIGDICQMADALAAERAKRMKGEG